MLRVYACIVQEHDFRLVIVAGIICLLAAFTAFTALDRARAGGKRRLAWLALTAFVSGTGIWSTHFVAMLAYQPHLPIGYDLSLTLLSIGAAILITGAGWQMAMREERWAAGLRRRHRRQRHRHHALYRHVGGEGRRLHGLGRDLCAAVGADRHRAQRRWPWPIIAAARASSRGARLCCSRSPSAASTSPRWRRRRSIPTRNYAVPAEAISGDTLTVAVVAMAAIILSISFVMVLFDRKLARHAAEEAQRMRAFADAAIEGLVVIDGEQVVDANRSFLDLSGYARRRGLAATARRPASRLDPGAGRRPARTPRRSKAGWSAPTAATATSRCCCGR